MDFMRASMQADIRNGHHGTMPPRTAAASQASGHCSATHTSGPTGSRTPLTRNGCRILLIAGRISRCHPSKRLHSRESALSTVPRTSRTTRSGAHCRARPLLENNVEMGFPDGTWDTVTEEVGLALTLSDPVTGQVGIYTAIMQNDTPGFLAVRLKVDDAKIVEIEHVVSTKRNLSGPPTPIGEVRDFRHDPDLERPVPPAERVARAELVRLADGYFSTLENNTGEIRGTKFAPGAFRFENGKLFPTSSRTSGWENTASTSARPRPFLVDEAAS
jgi:hypothetical protein